MKRSPGELHKLLDEFLTQTQSGDERTVCLRFQCMTFRITLIHYLVTPTASNSNLFKKLLKPLGVFELTVLSFSEVILLVLQDESLHPARKKMLCAYP